MKMKVFLGMDYFFELKIASKHKNIEKINLKRNVLLIFWKSMSHENLKVAVTLVHGLATLALNTKTAIKNPENISLFQKFYNIFTTKR